MINIASVVGVNTCIVILVITQKWKFNINILIMKQTTIPAFKYWLRIHGFRLEWFGTGTKKQSNQD